jgi:hypothetical protein
MTKIYIPTNLLPGNVLQPAALSESEELPEPGVAHFSGKSSGHEEEETE